MLAQVLGIINTALAACFGWFDDIVDSTGTYALIIGVFTLIVVTRTLIIPLIGFSFGGASDMARTEVKRASDAARSSFKNSKK